MAQHADAGDIFEDALGTLFEQPVIAHSAPPGHKHYTYSHPALAEKELKIALPAPPAGLNSLQAQYLWPSSLYLSHLILTRAIPLQAGQAVVELGAGSGLAGVCAALRLQGSGGGAVISTDWGDANILSTLRSNYERNLPGRPPHGEPASFKWAVAGHKWGDDVAPILTALDSSPNDPAQVDHLLLCDLLYYSAAHRDLLKSVLALMGPSSRAHITAGLHGGSTGAAERFVALAEDEGRCEVEIHGVFSWNAREEAWLRVREEEGYTEGMVWHGTLRLRQEGADGHVANGAG